MSKNIEKLYEKAIDQVVPDVLDEILVQNIVPMEKEDAIICPIKEQKSHKKNHTYLSFVGVAVAAMFLFFLYNRTVVETRIIIDINPSFEVQLNKQGQVKQVIGINKDAQNMLVQINFTDKDLDSTIKKLIETLDENGCFKEETAVLLSVQNKKEETALYMEKKLKKQIKQLCNNIETKPIIYTQSVGIDKEIQEVAENYHISQGRATFIYNMVKKDSTWKVEELASMTIEELVNSVKKKGVNISDILEKNDKTKETSTASKKDTKKNIIKPTSTPHKNIKENDKKQEKDIINATKKPSQKKKQQDNNYDDKITSEDENDKKQNQDKKGQKHNQDKKKDKSLSTPKPDKADYEDDDNRKKENDNKGEKENHSTTPPSDTEEHPERGKHNGTEEHQDQGGRDGQDGRDTDHRKR